MKKKIACAPNGCSKHASSRKRMPHKRGRSTRLLSRSFVTARGNSENSDSQELKDKKLIECRMTDTASLVPDANNDVYLVLDELPTSGRVWRELSEEAANEETVLKLIAAGDFHDPVRVIAFNVTEGSSRNVTGEIADALLDREASEGDLSQSARMFVG